MELHDRKIFKVVKCVLNKTLIACLLVAGTLAPTVSNAYAQSNAQQLNSKPYVSAQLSEPEKYGTITLVKTSQENLRIDNKFMYKPQRVGDRTVLAVKDVSDNLGLNLSWSEADQIATVKKDNTEVAIPLNRKVIAVNDAVKSMDTVAVVDKAVDRTYLPLWSMLEPFGYKVTYDGSNGNIMIYEPGVTVVPVTDDVIKGGVDVSKSKWYKATFDSVDESIEYHLSKHGKGRTLEQYTDEAMNFFNKNKNLGTEITLKDGTKGIKIQTGTGKNKIGGYWTNDGKLVTFWD